MRRVRSRGPKEGRSREHSALVTASAKVNLLWRFPACHVCTHPRVVLKFARDRCTVRCGIAASLYSPKKAWPPSVLLALHYSTFTIQMCSVRFDLSLTARLRRRPSVSEPAPGKPERLSPLTHSHRFTGAPRLAHISMGMPLPCIAMLSRGVVPIAVCTSLSDAALLHTHLVWLSSHDHGVACLQRDEELLVVDDAVRVAIKRCDERRCLLRSETKSVE